MKYTNTTKETNVFNKNKGFDTNDNFDICDDDSSNMKSNNKISTKRKHRTMSVEQLSTQLAFHFQITYYKLTHGKHKTPLQIMMENSIYPKTRRKRYHNKLKNCPSHN